jgi:predicted ATPase/DNA-binding SARP family transcriptional activator
MTWNSAPGPALSVLGPLSLHVDGRSVPLGGPLPRRLLGALMISRRATVSTDRLVEVLWGDDPPDNALASLRSYVSRLRLLLPSSARLDKAVPGYRLVLDPGTVDADGFEAALEHGLARLAHEPQAALVELDAALTLWQGDAFAEFRDDWWARAEATRLEELRLVAREARAEALLALGRDEVAVSEARALTVDYPGRERAWRTLVVGLHRGGRQREALEAANRYRAWLRDESGLDPSSEFAALESAVAVDAPHLRSDPSTLASRPARGAGRLPAPPTDFIGRVREAKELAALVEAKRAVTLTGAGGVGKTRLAVELATGLEGEFGEGACWVELAGLADPAAVPFAALAALRVAVQPGLSPTESAVDALRGRDLLLVLDNCEHVIDPCADLVGSLLAMCPTVAVLATSREPLRLAGERVHNVASLDAASDARDLFVDRAHSADDTFEVDDPSTVEDLCRRLDGIPLAIELAAAHVRSMSVAELLDRLDDRFELLRSRQRGGIARHQTMHSAVEWSYLLLSPDERTLFERLSVFSGTFDREAATAVCGTTPLVLADVGDLLDTLVDCSMVTVSRNGSATRYRLLETMRQFGAERLAACGRAVPASDRHLAHYVEVARRAGRQVTGRAYSTGAATFEVEWDNLRAALQRAIDLDDAATATTLLEATFWFAQGQQRHELGDWAGRVVGLGGAGAGAHGVAAKFAAIGGDYERALELARAGIARATPTEVFGLRLCREVVGRALWFSGRVDEGWAELQTWAALFEPDDESFEAAHATLALVGFAQLCDPSSIADRVARGRRMAGPLNNPHLELIGWLTTAWVEAEAGRFEAALTADWRAIEIATQVGELFIQGFARLSIGQFRIATADPGAGSALRDALVHLYGTRNWMLMWGALQTTAVWWAGEGRLASAAVLLGYLEAHDLRPPGPGHARGAEKRRRQQLVAELATTSDGTAWLQRGAELERNEVVAYALDELAGNG